MITLLLALAAQADGLREEVRAAVARAARYYTTEVARHGGYVYYTSLDLKERWGEGRATDSQIWVQPPGTPTVGLALLAASGDPGCLDGARAAAEALVRGQLQSGGWTNHIDFDPRGRRAGKYRAIPGGSWNASSLDDGQTTTALRFLIRADEAFAFKNAAIHEAARFGLDALLKAQFPSGGFPQVWTGPVETRVHAKASFPDYDWKTEQRVKEYWSLPTLNDGIAGQVLDVLAEARRVYKDERFLAAIRRLGDFLLLARLPEPQPAWAQQYTHEMRPAWARKFEPPAVTGWESQDAIDTLIRIASLSGRKEYLDGLPRSLEYLRKSTLPDGTLARFYELRSNRPLYMDREYKLTYEAADAPAHYGWTQPSRLDRLQAALDGAGKGAPAPAVDEKEVRKILAALDAQGRWVSTYAGERLAGQPSFRAGFAYLDSGVFSRNLETLARFLRP